MTKTKITAHTYVCELPETIQNQIFQECKETFESLAFPVDIQEQIEHVRRCTECSKSYSVVKIHIRQPSEKTLPTLTQ